MAFEISTATILAFASIACFATITAVSQGHFTVKGRVPFGTIVIAAAALSSVAISVWCIWTAPGSLLLPIALYAASLALFVWTVRTTRGRSFVLAFTEGVPTSLTIDGPYRFVRHPFYVSYLLYHLGNAVATVSWLPLGMLVLMLAIYVVAARNEEGQLARGSYANAYGAYRRRTGMFFPKFWNG